MQVRNLLVATHIERADDDRSALERAGDLTVGVELLLLGRKLSRVHEQELGTEQADSLGVVIERVGHVIGVADVAGDDLLDAIGSHGRLAAEGLEGCLLGSEGLGLGGVGSERLLVGIGLDDTLATVDDDSHAVAQRGAAVGNRKDSRDLEGARDNRRVRRAAAGLGDDTGNVSLIDRGGHGRREVVHDNDGVLGQDGEVDDLLAQQLGQNTGADVGDVGRAQTEHLIIHGQEHVLEHGRGVHERLLGAGAAVNGGVDGVGHARILSQDNVSAHDLGLGLAHRLLHVVGLSLGLLAEDRKSGLIALLLCCRISNLVRLKRQVGIDGDHDGADTDALGSVDSLIHSHSSLRVM